jgi:hypothetical protein
LPTVRVIAGRRPLSLGAAKYNDQEIEMKRSIFRTAALAAAITGGLAAPAMAQTTVIDPQGAVLTDASYFFGGEQYCWYSDGWEGPGWYWCGYAWRDGLGWGGPRGWHGWHRGGGHGGGHLGGGGHVGGGHIGGGHFGGSGHIGGGGHFGGGGHMGGGGHFGGGGGHGGGGGRR